MLRGAPARIEDATPILQVPAVDVATLTLSHPKVRAHARAAWMPRGTGPMDAAAGGL
jgi:hypothetical protein